MSSIKLLSFDYILITNLMHWLLFIHRILFSSTCFEPQAFIFRRIQLYTCSLWYCHSLWEYHMLHVYNCILLKMSAWGSTHVEENNILWINNNHCIKLVINTKSIHDARSEKYQVILSVGPVLLSVFTKLIWDR